MAETAESSLYVARPADVAALRAHFDAVTDGGTGRTLSLQAPIGGGKRALVGELVRSLGEADALIWRTALIDEEDGLRTLLRLYATLYAQLHQNNTLRGRVELILNSQLPKQPKRVQNWYLAFIDGLRKGGPKEGEQSFQVSLPKDNPAMGLVEIVSGIARKLPVLADIQNVHASQSISVHAVFEALHHRRGELKLLQILSMETLDEGARAWMPSPLIDLLDRRADEIERVEVAPWGAEEVAAYLASKGLEGPAADIARIASGRPGYIAELVDILSDAGRLGDDLSEATLSSLMPRAVDEDELSEPKAAEGDGPRRRHALAADLDDVAFRAALLGRAFPSNLVADVGNYERDSIDDLLDATGDLFEELQFSKPLGTWIYQFKRAAWREGALEAGRSREGAAAIARDTAMFLERFLVPRGYEFMVKTARIFAEAGEPRRAAVLRSMALSADRPELWAMNRDLINTFKDVGWPDAMRRTVLMNLMDRMVAAGNVEQTEQLFNEIMAWADQIDDRPLKAWNLFAGSRLDYRRQDHYRARDRAKDALTLYKALQDPVKPGEILNHIALVELSDGNAAAAREAVNEALRTGQVETPEGPRVLPQVAANAEFIRGLLDKGERKFKEAAEHFRLANEIAGNTAQAALALEAGLHYGECLLAAGDTAHAADVLQRVLGIAQALQNPVRQRAATSLLAQAHASLKQFEAALRWARATLELTQQLKFDRFMAIDTFNVGQFTMMLQRPTEALALFKQARGLANLQQDVVFSKELLYNIASAALAVGENSQAAEAFRAMMPFANQAKDWPKVIAAGHNLGVLAAAAGDRNAARRYLTQAMDVAEKQGLKDERRRLRKKLDELG